MIVSGASLTATALPQPSTVLLVNLGVRGNQFGFTTLGPTSLGVVVIEVCNKLVDLIILPK